MNNKGTLISLDLLPAAVIFAVILFVSLSVYSLADSLNENDGESIFSDRDQDGLSDEEEEALGTDPMLKDTDGDSYSDGVEVESGFDPLIPAPDDRLDTYGVGGEDPSLLDESEDEQDDASATEVFTNDLNNYLANSVEEGKEEISVDELTAIADASVAAAISYDDLPEIDLDEIIIKEQSYDDLSDEKKIERERQDAIQYFTASSYILFSHLPATPSGATDVMEILDHVTNNVNTIGTASPSPYLKELSESSDKVLNKLKDIEVPQQYVDIHVRGMQLAQYGSVLSKDIEMSETDPLSTISTLSQIQGLFGISAEYVNELNQIFTDISILDEEIEL